MSESLLPWNDNAEEHAVDTPEQVELRFPLAGLGSRFLAVLLDTLIQLAFYIVVLIVIALAFNAGMRTGALDRMSNTAQKWFAAGIILANFLLLWGYYALFEAFRNGQTPGKRVLKIRVIKDSGRQITFFESLARNLLRVVDALPGMYLIGVISILVTRRNKRLGDLLADTLVIHERVDEYGGYIPPVSQFGASAMANAQDAIASDRIAKLGADDLHLIDSFLARAVSLPQETREQLASRLLLNLCTKMGAAMPVAVAPERTLESIAYALRAQGMR